MTSLARRLLDELMGLDRNKPFHLRGPKKHRFDHPDVCKYYLVDFCPYELFMNTKSDVGTCPYKVHDDIIKGEFEREGAEFRERYEQRFVSKLEDLVNELERKLRRGRERLESHLPVEGAGLNPVNDEIEEEKVLLASQIKEMLNKVEELGEEGRISEAKTMSMRVEQLKEQLEKLKQTESESSTFRLERKLEQCQTCGAMLVVNDAPLRIQSHYEGRQHNGWDRVRKTLEEWRLKAPNYVRERRRDSGIDGMESRRRDDRRDERASGDHRSHHRHHDDYDRRRYDNYDSRDRDRRHHDRYEERDDRSRYDRPRHRSRSPRSHRY